MKKIKNLKKRLGVLLIALCLSVLSVCEVSAQVKFPIQRICNGQCI